MILHLLTTDWQRLRLPIVGVWLVLLLSTLPWLGHPLESFTAPWAMTGSWNSSTPSVVVDSVHRQVIHGDLVQFLTTLATLSLSAAIGMHGISWQGASPIRPWKRATAKLLSLLAFLIVPQLLLAALILGFRGFSPAILAAASVGSGLSLVLLHGASALFAYRCGSPWPWLVGLAGVAGGFAVINARFPGNLPLTPFLEPWGTERGPQTWTYGVLAITGLVILPALVRRRAGEWPVVAAAVVAMLVATIPARKLPVIARFPWQPSENTSAIQPRIVPQSLRTDDQFYAATEQESLHVSVGIETEGDPPPGTFVVWSSAPQWAHQSVFSTRAFPREQSPIDQAAMSAALSDPLLEQPRGGSAFPQNVSGTFKDIAQVPDAGLVIPLTGHRFRYTVLAEVPFGENPATHRDGSFTLITRRVAADEGLFLDVAFQGPALGVAPDPRALIWNPPAIEAWRFLLHFPEEGLRVPLQSKFEQSSPIPGGGAWTRRVYQPDRHADLRKFDARNARVIILSPQIVEEFHRTVTVFPADSSSNATDWTMARNYSLSLHAYLANHRPFRPGPETCSGPAFARYLRAVSAVFGSDLPDRDLAAYAPRFSRLLALHAARDPAADALRTGAPESQRETVIQTLHANPELATPLAETLLERGWHSEARDELLSAIAQVPPGYDDWPSHHLAVVRAIVGLEDPSAYPALLSLLEKTRSFELYQTLRPLPAITPLLDRTVADIGRDLSAVAELSRVQHRMYFRVFDPFMAPVAHGDRTALDEAIVLFRLLPDDLSGFTFIDTFAGFFDLPLESSIEAWRTYFAGKSASDFTHDPLTRKWRPNP